MKDKKLKTCLFWNSHYFMTLFSATCAETTRFTFKHVCHVYDSYFEKAGIKKLWSIISAWYSQQWVWGKLVQTVFKENKKKVGAGLSIIKTDFGKKTSRKERVRACALIISRWFIKHSYTFHSQTCQSDLGTLFSSFDMQVFEAVWALRRSIITALSPFPNLFDEKKKNPFRK